MAEGKLGDWKDNILTGSAWKMAISYLIAGFQKKFRVKLAKQQCLHVHEIR
jgi:hypothetical protein